MPARTETGGELALAMADLDASQRAYSDALAWLEVYAEHAPLPLDYQRKRQLWMRRARGPGGSTRPRSSRRRATIDPQYD